MRASIHNGPRDVSIDEIPDAEVERPTDVVMPGGAFGVAGMGPYEGGQAEYLRVRWADVNCLLLPPDAKEKENDYLMLSDISPTGRHATELAGVKPGDSVVVYGGGWVRARGPGRPGRACQARADRRRFRFVSVQGAAHVDDRDEGWTKVILNPAA